MPRENRVLSCLFTPSQLWMCCVASIMQRRLKLKSQIPKRRSVSETTHGYLATGGNTRLSETPSKGCNLTIIHGALWGSSSAMFLRANVLRRSRLQAMNSNWRCYNSLVMMFKSKLLVLVLVSCHTQSWDPGRQPRNACLIGLQSPQPYDIDFGVYCQSRQFLSFNWCKLAASRRGDGRRLHRWSLSLSR